MRGMKRAKLLTKKERRALVAPGARAAKAGSGQHIHCVACGRHIDPEELQAVVNQTATILTCQHGSRFASCVECAPRSQELLDEHDRTNRPVATAAAWH